MERTFYKASMGVVIAMMAFVVFAFFRTYFGQFPSFENTDWVIHVHVIAVCLWMIMLLIQPMLIYRKQWDLHRAIGRFSYIYFPFLLLTCFMIMHHMQTTNKDVHIFTVNIFMLILLCAYYGLAIYYRKTNSAWHGRFMMLTLIPFIGPATSRVGYNVHAIELSIIITLLVVEIFRSRIFKPYVIGIGIYIALFIPFVMVMMQIEVLEWIWSVFFG